MARRMRRTRKKRKTRSRTCQLASLTEWCLRMPVYCWSMSCQSPGNNDSDKFVDQRRQIAIEVARLLLRHARGQAHLRTRQAWGSTTRGPAHLVQAVWVAVPTIERREKGLLTMMIGHGVPAEARQLGGSEGLGQVSELSRILFYQMPLSMKNHTLLMTPFGQAGGPRP